MKRPTFLKNFWILGGIGLTALPALAADKDFTIIPEPAIQDMRIVQGSFPIRVTLENKGPNAAGVLRVDARGGSVIYPMELPRGTTKSLLVYATAERYEYEVTLRLITDKGTAQMVYRPEGFAENSRTAAIISDTIGGLSFLKASQQPVGGTTYSPQNILGGAYARPGELPSRVAALSGVTIFFLGEGSERLGDEEVQALQTWVLTGGTLIIPSGASAPVLRDQRWRSFLPVVPLQASTLTRSSLIEELGGQPLAQPFSITESKPVQGAFLRRDQQKILIAEKPFGLGKVVFWAFNPFEPPFNKWEGRVKLIRDVLQKSESQALLASVFNLVDTETPYSALTPSAPTVTKQVKEDPFSTKMPPTMKVFWILVLYFVMVVPVNFLVLRAFKKGEWAWLTAPLISLGFAGVFFTFAKDLYASGMSAASTGVLIAHETHPEAYFSGKSMLFMPQAGNYDLKLEGVESIFRHDQNNWSGGGMSVLGNSPLEPLDIGQMIVPSFRVNNLAFNEFQVRQRVNQQGWFRSHIQVVGTSKDQRTRGYKIQITNRSPYTLSNGQLVVDGLPQKLKKPLKPGETVAFEFSKKISKVNENDSQGDKMSFGISPGSSLNEHTATLSLGGRILLHGYLDGFRAGPNIGQQIATRNKISLFYYLNEGAKL